MADDDLENIYIGNYKVLKSWCIFAFSIWEVLFVI